MANLQNAYIVRYYYSWFEKPPVDWQQKKDRYLLKSTKSFDDESNDFTDSYNITSLNNSVTSTSGIGNSANDYNYNFKSFKNDSFSSYGADDTSSSFIVFQNSSTNVNRAVSSDVIDEDCEEDDFNETNESNRKKERRGTLETNTTNQNDSNGTDGDQDDDFDDFSISKSEAPDGNGDAMKKQKSSNIYLYIQMELCSKNTLRHWLNNHAGEERPRKRVAQIFSQILDAISYIHSQNLVHRDLKVCLDK